jgi:hypothetical protein
MMKDKDAQLRLEKGRERGKSEVWGKLPAASTQVTVQLLVVRLKLL